MAKTSKELRQELGELVTQQRTILDRAQAEKRKRMADEETELKNLDTRMDALEKEIPELEKLEARESLLAQPARGPVQRPAIDSGTGDGEEAQRKLEADFRTRFGTRGHYIARNIPGNKLATPIYRRAFDRY